MLKKILQNQKGGTLLVYTVMVFSAMMITVFALNSIVLNRLKVSSVQSEGTRAYFAAEAGAEWLLNQLLVLGKTPHAGCTNDRYLNLPSDIDVACVNNENSKIALSNGAEFLIQKIAPVGTATYTFKCIGEYKGARRIVQISL